MTKKSEVPILFTDIDGTIRKGKAETGRYVNTADDVEVFGEAIELMLRWKTMGGRIVGVSNQGGVALGLLTEEDMTAAMIETQRQTGGLFDHILACRHHPDAKTSELSECDCRKPLPGLIFQGMTLLEGRHPDETYPLDLALMVGDLPVDRQCAAAAGVPFMDAVEWRGLLDA